MLRIRFSRTGKVGQPSYRIMVADKRASVKGRYIEMLGHYMPGRKPKVVVINQERIAYWISKGAKPTDSIASLLKKQGMDGMDKFLEPRNKQRKKKGTEEKKTEVKTETAEIKPAEKPA